MDPIERIRRMLDASGHFDSSESLFFARQLEHIKVELLQKKYPDLKARRFIPVSNEADPGADEITYRMYDRYGHARITNNQADDAPLVGLNGVEVTQKVFTVDVSYQYTTQDIRRAAKAQYPLESQQAMAARRAVEEKFDEYAALGNTALGTKGLLNHASVPVVVLPNTGAFMGLSAQQMLDNLYTIVGSIPQVTLETHIPDTLLLDTYTFTALSQVNVGLDNQESVLNSFLKNNPYIKNIESWNRLNTAGAGSIRRMLCYKRDPEVIQLNIPMEFQQLPPQARGTRFIVPCEARIGGTEIRYPKALAYADIAV